MKCGYWKYSPRVVKISPREAQPREVIFDHKRWIFPISTFQIVDIHIIHNFMPPCSRLKWELKKKPKKSIFSKSANIYLHKSNIRHFKWRILDLWSENICHFKWRILDLCSEIFALFSSNDGYWIYVGKYLHFLKTWIFTLKDYMGE